MTAYQLHKAIIAIKTYRARVHFGTTWTMGTIQMEREELLLLVHQDNGQIAAIDIAAIVAIEGKS